MIVMTPSTHFDKISQYIRSYNHFLRILTINVFNVYIIKEATKIIFTVFT